MMVDTATADLLDQCVRDVRAGRKTVEECLAAHPEQREELEPLLGAALSIRPPIVRPDPQRKLRARHAFVEAIAQEKRGARLGWRALPGELLSGQLFRGAQSMRLAAIAINILAILILGTTAVVSAKEAQPGDLLYGLKTGIEQVQVAVALTPETRAQIRLQIATERLNEVQRALASDKRTIADSAATAYATTMGEAQRDLADARPTGERLDAIQRTLQENLTKQQEVLVQASEKGAVGTEHTIREVQVHHTISVTPGGAVPSGGSDVVGSVRGRDAASQASATATSDAETNRADEEPARRVVQIDVPPPPTQTSAPTATATPPARNVVGSVAAVTETQTAEPTSGPSLTPTIAAATVTSTRVATATRRATATPSVTPSVLPTNQTIVASPSVSPMQRGGVTGGDEVGRPGGTSASGSVSASGRTSTILPTITPTQLGAVYNRGVVQRTLTPTAGLNRGNPPTPSSTPPAD